MSNPWIILAVVLAIGGAAVSGYAKGRHDANADAIVERQKAIDATIAAHNADTVIDMQAAYERGQQESRVKIVTRTIQTEATAAPPIVHCPPLDVAHRKLLDRAVDVYNGEVTK